VSIYYQHGGVTIYHGDCRDILPTLAAPASIVTDPPYGIAWSRATWEDDPAQYGEMMRWLSAEATRLGHWAFVFQSMLNCGHFHEWFPPGWRLFAACKNFAQIRLGVWRSWDPVVFWYAGEDKEPRPVGYVGRDYHVGNVAGVFGDGNDHPCPRPTDTMRHIVALTTGAPGGVIDPFMGSGTTLVAAKSLGVQAVGIEMNEKYCEMAARRLDQECLALPARVAVETPPRLP